MKILMVLSSYFPPDSRVEKEVVSLAEDGHEVHILCYLKNGHSLFEDKKLYKIHRIKASGFFINKLSALALIFPNYFSKWKKSIQILHSKYKFDAMHIHDLPLSKVGYYFKKKYDCKLICDQHEFYSDWIIRTAHMNTLAGRITSFVSNWKSYEEKYLKIADLIITVAKPLEENYIERYAIENEKIITVPNTPTRKVYNLNNVNPAIVNSYKNNFVIFYAGGIDILRGIDTIIDSLPELRKKIPNIKFVFGGKIVKPYNPFKTAIKWKVEDLLDFKGWIDESEIPSYIAASNICIFTPPANRDEINKTIATKIYQYAIMGKPIIVSEAKMMKEFIENNELGISIHSGNTDEFIRAVLDISQKHHFSKRRINDSWLWEETVKPMIEKYRTFTKEKFN
jgi:glycosyltransferase involved in cell wall biosynthesis